ncbi:MAG: pyridoxamine 5'-phosphate oxidase family protein [Robiginitalea sp.]|jgi:hypothetical protein
MGKQLTSLSNRLIDFIEDQPIFFVATAMKEGRINLSPKGMDTLRIPDPNTVLWLNLTGSGNETAAHLRADPRITIMWCAFKGEPRILRVYGTARTYAEGTDFWERHSGLFPEYAGSRQLVAVRVASVLISCGMGVPLMEYKGERELLEPWASGLGLEGMHAYRQAKNTKSLDGHPTDIPDENRKP